MSLADFHFLRPLWLLALPLVALLPWWWRRAGASSGGWKQVVDAHLLEFQLQRGRRRRAPLLLAMLGATLALLALAGPAWREAPQPLQQREAPLAIVLEVSDSMRAADLPPQRLASARFALTDLLRTRSDGQFALVAYAGAAFTVAPVTDDGTTLLALLNALDPAQMPVGGADAARALQHAADLLESAGFAHGDILLVADDADAAASAAAAQAHARGYRVSVLGIGTAAGAPVALPGGGFLKDASGAIVVPALQADALRAVAAAGAGRYATLVPGRKAIEALQLATAGSDRYQASEDARQAFVDDGPWLVLLLLPIAALAFRRGWLGCVLVLGLLPPPAAHALDWDALWQRDDQRAWDALQHGDAERAAALARDPALKGSALYRGGEMEQAIGAFAASAGADAHYNRGNALAGAQRFEEAIAAYDAALALEPQMEDALANRAAVEEWLRQQQSQPGEDPGEGEQGEQGDDPSGQQDGQQDGQQQQDGQGEQEGEPGDPGDGDQQQDGQPGEGERDDGSGAEDAPAAAAAEDEQARAEREQQFAQDMQQALDAAGKEDAQQAQQGEVRMDPAEREQRQAVEQWLQRVPDDPGGLLRRKFLIEHQRRAREQGDRP